MLFSEALKKNRDFKKVYENGRSRANKYLIMYVKANGTDKNRLGISVSKKVGNSVVRHRLTRIVREAFRLNAHVFKKGYDIVAVIREPLKGKGIDTAQKSLMKLLGKHDVLRKYHL